MRHYFSRKSIRVKRVGHTVRRGALLAGALWALCITGRPCCAPAWAQSRYPKDISWRLVTESEVKKATGCPEKPGKARSFAPPLFPQPQLPLDGISVMPNSGKALSTAPRHEDSIPFASIAPPLPENLPKDVKEQLLESEARRQAAQPKPAAFGDLSVDPNQDNAPSALLRPIAPSMSDQFFAPESTLPEPYSLRRYYTKEHGFFQISVYSGDTSFDTQRQYRTLKMAAPNRQMVPGIGSEAFLTYLDPNNLQTERPDSNIVKNSTDAEEADTPDDGREAGDLGDLTALAGRHKERTTGGPHEPMSFSDLTPQGEVRFDLIDKGLYLASQAPSFNEIPVEDKLPEEFNDALRVELGIYKEMPKRQATDGEAAEDSQAADSGTASTPDSISGSAPDSEPAPAAFGDLNPQSERGISSQDGWQSLGENGPEPSPNAMSAPGAFSPQQPPEMVSILDSAEAYEMEVNPFTVREYEGTGPAIQVLTVFLPDGNLVVELAMDSRMGNFAHLLQLAFLVRTRVKNNWHNGHFPAK